MEGTIMSATTTTDLDVSKHFSCSILLWIRNDQPRQTGMDYWKGPHSGIIANTPGQHEYRQIHLAEHNPGRWPATAGVETVIPADRKIDGMAEVTFENALSPPAGRKQTALASAGTTSPPEARPDRGPSSTSAGARTSAQWAFTGS
jgi:hypothetical protein